jgi:biotin carboxyl carrier protein
MLRPKIVIVLALSLIILAVAWAAAEGSAVDQKSVLAGQVLADNLVVPGTAVHEGDVLIMIGTITGPVPAVRANVDGKVKEVLVKPGDSIQTGQVLVRIEQVR